MSRKLIFTLSPNRQMGLSFFTHYRSDMAIVPKQVLPFTLREDDLLSKEELLAFYEKYKSLGLMTKFIEDATNLDAPAKVDINPEQLLSSTPPEDLLPPLDLLQDSNPEQKEPELPAKPRPYANLTENTIDGMGYNDLKRIYGELKDEYHLELKGRTQEDYKEVLKQYINQK